MITDSNEACPNRKFAIGNWNPSVGKLGDLQSAEELSNEPCSNNPTGYEPDEVKARLAKKTSRMFSKVQTCVGVDESGVKKVGKWIRKNYVLQLAFPLTVTPVRVTVWQQ